LYSVPTPASGKPHGSPAQERNHTIGPKPNISQLNYLIHDLQYNVARLDQLRRGDGDSRDLSASSRQLTEMHNPRVPRAFPYHTLSHDHRCSPATVFLEFWNPHAERPTLKKWPPGVEKLSGCARRISCVVLAGVNVGYSVVVVEECLGTMWTLIPASNAKETVTWLLAMLVARGHSATHRQRRWQRRT